MFFIILIYFFNYTRMRGPTIRTSPLLVYLFHLNGKRGAQLRSCYVITAI